MTISPLREAAADHPIQSPRHPSSWFLAACAIAAVTFCVMVICSPHALLYDEPLHLQGARLLAAGSSLHDVLLAPLPSAPGPLYSVLQAAISPVTGFQAPLIRYLNLLLLFAGATALAFSLQRCRPDSSWLCAGMLLSVPMTWVTAGLALTEIPAMTMVNLGLAAGVWAAWQEERRGRCYLGFITAGLCMGVAITGRQTYLPLLVIFPVIGMFEARWRWPAAAAFLISCAIPLPMFLVWRGLTPPSQAYLGGGISLEHGLLAFAYLAVVVAIIAPRFYESGWRWVFAAAGGGAVLNLVLVHFEWDAAAGLAKHLPLFLQRWYTVVVGSVLIAAFSGFAAAVVFNVWNRRQDRWFLLMTVETMLLIGTAFGIVHLFSSRYVMAGFPFIMLMLQPFFIPSKWAASRLVVGAALGCASLSTYYSQSP